MDIRLIRRPHTNQMVRASGIKPTETYLEMCWLPVVGPSTVALVRHVAHMTADSGEASVPISDLGRQLGLGPVNAPTRNNKFIRTLDRAEQFGLAFSSFGAPAESITFGTHNEIALIPNRMLDRLPTAARHHHLATVEAVNDTLEASGLPAVRSHLPARDVAPPGPASAATARRFVAPQAPAVEAPRTRQAVPPIARLEARTPTRTTPDLSL